MFYRLAKVVFVAGSFRWQGHNPIEPALLGSAVASGPNVANFHDIFERMRKAAAVTIAGEEELAGAIDQLLADPGPAGARAETFARQQAEGILVRVVAALEPVVSPEASIAVPRRGKTDCANLNSGGAMPIHGRPAR